MLTKYTIYGERCSGTNYLENIINMNFDIKLTCEYGWKHFFGFQDDLLKNSDDTLFICIIRNLPDWLNSLYTEQFHIADHLRGNIDSFLNQQFYSYNDKYSSLKNGKEIMEDRNIYTGERYKNIFELRHTKIKWMYQDLPNKVKNGIIIRYEDLINNFENTLFRIKNKGLKVKQNINFPLNTDNYANLKNKKFIKKNNNNISSKFILSNRNLIPFYEKKLYNI